MRTPGNSTKSSHCTSLRESVVYSTAPRQLKVLVTRNGINSSVWGLEIRSFVRMKNSCGICQGMLRLSCDASERVDRIIAAQRPRFGRSSADIHFRHIVLGQAASL